MNMRRILGIIIILAGIGGIGTSLYIKKEVAKGRVQIADGQRKVDTGKAIFGLSPATKPVGEGLTAGAQSQIDQGRHDIAYYERLSNMLMIGGVICVVLGGIITFYPCKSS